MTQLATDAFTRANGGLGANWTTAGGSSAPTVFSNTASCGTSGTNTAACYTGVGAVANDQYSQATIQLVASTQYAGVSVRSSTSADTSYVFFTGGIGSSQTLTLAKRVAGVFTSLKTTTATVTAGDTLYLEIQGTTLVCKQNGSVISALGTTDASIASGTPGFLMNGNGTDGGSEIDNFAMGNFASSTSTGAQYYYSRGAR